jgi:glucose-6-phosphate 1-dehydrogenase
VSHESRNPDIAGTTANDARLNPTIIVIFGITGDLAGRYLLPSLYHLFKDGLLSEQTEIIGITRRDISADELLGQTELCVLEKNKTCDPAAIKRMRDALSLFKMELDSGPDYARLRVRLDEIEEKHGVCMNRLYYLSLPPSVYPPIVEFLGENKLNKSCKHHNAETRLLVEKPFGYDLASARELIEETGKCFEEKQIYRIDHYLAKETVQNILTFRLHNPIFEALWNKEHIESIEITAKETIDIEGRAVFYDSTGALRDVVQSHLLQLLAVTAMEKPAAMDSGAIHAARRKLLQSVKPVPPVKINERTVRGQYDGYREEVNNSNSTTETFAGIKLFIDNERWSGVPVVIRTGKALEQRITAIDVKFKHQKGATHHPNKLSFIIQPNEGISLDLYVKRPGFESDMRIVPMDFSYARSFGTDPGHPNAYERVLVDAVRGDQTLFATSEEVLASWRVLQPVLDGWAKDGTDIQRYKKGNFGPDTNL